MTLGIHTPCWHISVVERPTTCELKAVEIATRCGKLNEVDEIATAVTMISLVNDTVVVTTGKNVFFFFETKEVAHEILDEEACLSLVGNNTLFLASDFNVYCVDILATRPFVERIWESSGGLITNISLDSGELTVSSEGDKDYVLTISGDVT